MEDAESNTPGVFNRRRFHHGSRKRKRSNDHLGLTPSQIRHTAKKWLRATGKTLDGMIQALFEEGGELDFDLPPGVIFEDAQILFKAYRRLLQNAASAKRSRINAKRRIRDLETKVSDLRAERERVMVYAETMTARLRQQCEKLNAKVGRLEAKTLISDENIDELRHQLSVTQEWVWLSLPPPLTEEQERWFSSSMICQVQEIPAIHPSVLSGGGGGGCGETPPLFWNPAMLEGDNNDCRDAISLVDVGIVPTQGPQGR